MTDKFICCLFISFSHTICIWDMCVDGYIAGSMKFHIWWLNERDRERERKILNKIHLVYVDRKSNANAIISVVCSFPPSLNTCAHVLGTELHTSYVCISHANVRELLHSTASNRRDEEENNKPDNNKYRSKKQQIKSTKRNKKREEIDWNLSNARTYMTISS